MIAVIADDFTGAAEIGGIGLRHGLEVILETEPMQPPQADLLVIATDTRSLPPDKAIAHISRITRQLLQFRPDFIYKKLDSVLRGNITAELLAQMEASAKSRAIIVAANPVFKRIIRDGIYYIDQVPLQETYFSADPQFPIASSAVLEILNPEDKSILINLKPENALPEKGLIIGDVTHLEDLEQWAMKMDEHTLLAGASGFFNAILGKQPLLAENHRKKTVPPPAFGGKALFVLGSAFSKDHGSLKKLNGHYVSNMPKAIYDNQHFDAHHLEEWVEDIVNAFRAHQTVIVSILHARSSETNLASRIRETMGVLVKAVVAKVDLNELLIEGGSTTSAILRHLNIKKLWPVQELDTGVIRMKTEENAKLYITTKPGSYVWPEDLWVPQDRQRMNNNMIKS